MAEGWGGSAAEEGSAAEDLEDLAAPERAPAAGFEDFEEEDVGRPDDKPI